MNERPGHGQILDDLARGTLSTTKESDPGPSVPSARNLTGGSGIGGYHPTLGWDRVVVRGHRPQLAVDRALEAEGANRGVELEQLVDLAGLGGAGLQQALERR